MSCLETTVSVLAAEDICVSFGGVRALQGVTLRLEPGRIYGLIGPNGAGKTTLFNVLSGIVAPDAGQIRLGGIDATRWPAHRRAQAGVARTFQNLALFPSMTVAQNIRAGGLGRRHTSWLAAMLGLDGRPQGSDPELESLIDAMDLRTLAEAPVLQLPLASRKKVEIARALAGRPQILLLDEPAAGLGASEMDELAALVRSLGERGMTVLVVEHHMELVMSLCEHLFVLDFGTLIAEGAPQAIRQHPEVLRAYLGNETADATV